MYSNQNSNKSSRSKTRNTLVFSTILILIDAIFKNTQWKMILYAGISIGILQE